MMTTVLAVAEAQAKKTMGGFHESRLLAIANAGDLSARLDPPTVVDVLV